MTMNEQKEARALTPAGPEELERRLERLVRALEGALKPGVHLAVIRTRRGPQAVLTAEGVSRVTALLGLTPRILSARVEGGVALVHLCLETRAGGVVAEGVGAAAAGDREMEGQGVNALLKRAHHRAARDALLHIPLVREALAEAVRRRVRMVEGRTEGGTRAQDRP